MLRDEAIGEIIVQADDLQHRIRELGAEISRDYADKDLLLIGVLKGAVFFLSDLMRQIDVPCEVDFMAVASYGSSTDSSGVVRILKDLDAPLEIRPWRPGDRMRPLGLGGSRTLQDLFTDRKVPRAWRARTPVVVSGGEIAWVPGVATGDRFRVGERTRRRARLAWAPAVAPPT